MNDAPPKDQPKRMTREYYLVWDEDLELLASAVSIVQKDPAVQPEYLPMLEGLYQRIAAELERRR